MNLNSIIASILNINAAEFEVLVEGRGMRPVKAAIRLGAEPDKAQIFAGLKLATSALEIDEVYANENVRSCQTGKRPGRFYQDNGIAVIYSNNYRCLVNPSTMSMAVRHGWSGYGYHRDQISHVLKRHIPGNVFWGKEVTAQDVEYGTGRFYYKPSIKAYIYGWRVTAVEGVLKDKGSRFRLRELSRWILTGENIWNWSEYDAVHDYLEEYLEGVEKSIHKTIQIDLADHLQGKASSVTLTLSCVKAEENAYSNYCSYERCYKRSGYYHDLARRGCSGEFEENTEHRVKVYGYFRATFILDVRAIKTEERRIKTKYFNSDKIVRNPGVFVPFLDIEESQEELPDSILIFEDKVDAIEDYYLDRLGDSYKERMNHPRRNLSRGRKSAA